LEAAPGRRGVRTFSNGGLSRLETPRATSKSIPALVWLAVRFGVTEGRSRIQDDP
jgi:hypothetical protein